MLAGLGCGGASSAAERQMEQFRKDIAKVQADNDRFNERLSALEQSKGGGALEAKAKAAQGDAPKLQVVKLTPGDDPDDPAAAAQEEAVEPDNAEPTVIRAEGNRSQVTQGGKDKAKEAPRSPQATREYDAALSLVKRKQYDKALEALSAFLVKYPGDPSADNAMYWRGECFYAKGEWARASDEFAGVVARFPGGNKAPDALLKVGMCQLKSGNKDKANETFARLRRDYPSSEAIRKTPRE
jgi:tol-pal system protein YbgF